MIQTPGMSKAEHSTESFINNNNPHFESLKFPNGMSVGPPVYKNYENYEGDHGMTPLRGNKNHQMEEDDLPILHGDLNEFRGDVDEFSTLEQRIKDLSGKIKPYQQLIKELKSKKIELKTDICKYMRNNEIDVCNLPNNKGSIHFTQRKIKKSLTQQVIKDTLYRFFSSGPGKNRYFDDLTDEQKASAVYNFLQNDREYKKSEVLRLKLSG